MKSCYSILSTCFVATETCAGFVNYKFLDRVSDWGGRAGWPEANFASAQPGISSKHGGCRDT